MNSIAFARRESPFKMLRRIALPRATIEQCEFCSQPLHPGHRHLLEVATRKISCTCDGCGLRFENVVGRWKLIPRDVRRLSGFQMTDADWAGLSLPIDLAFLFRSTPAERVVAIYPSPAGATESLLSLANWDSLTRANPVVSDMESDVEALLVNRLRDSREYFLSPIDACFELIGLIRVHWRGFSGGDRLWTEVDSYFSKLRERALPMDEPLTEANHA